MLAIANQEWCFINESFSIDSIIILANTKKIISNNLYDSEIKTNDFVRDMWKVTISDIKLYSY